MKTLLKFCLLVTAVILNTAILELAAQDDSYHPIRFVNESDKAVKITVWNPRSERKADNWTIEAGKTFDFADDSGKKLIFGIYSSKIIVDDAPEVALVSVAKRSEDGLRILTWTGKGFKKPDSGQ